MQECSQCSTPTNNPKFCCKSCSAKFNNKANPKRKIQRVCSRCDQKCKHWKTLLCSKHHEEYIQKRAAFCETKTLEEYRRGEKTNKFSGVRGLARTKFKHLLLLPCKCGYSKHVEICHKRPISDFPLTTLISEVNHPDNIVQLCRNCHWELDHHI